MIVSHVNELKRKKSGLNKHPVSPLTKRATLHTPFTCFACFPSLSCSLFPNFEIEERIRGSNEEDIALKQRENDGKISKLKWSKKVTERVELNVQCQKFNHSL